MAPSAWLLVWWLSQAGPSGPEAAAREHFARARELYHHHRWTEAIREFQASYRLSPHPSLLFNIGQAYAREGDLSGALFSYTEYLREAPDAKDRAAVEVSIQDLAHELAREGKQLLIVRTTPEGATVEVDGKTRGQTPFFTELPLGRHALTVSQEGYAPEHREFEAGDSQVPFDLRLVPAPLRPPVTSSQPGAATAPLEAVRRPAEGARHAAWIPAVAGGALAVGGGVLYGISRHMASQLAGGDPSLGSSQAAIDAYASRGQALQTTGLVLVGAGVVGLAVAGGMALFGRPTPAPAPLTLGVGASGHGISVALGGALP